MQNLTMEQVGNSLIAYVYSDNKSCFVRIQRYCREVYVNYSETYVLTNQPEISPEGAVKFTGYRMYFKTYRPRPFDVFYDYDSNYKFFTKDKFAKEKSKIYIPDSTVTERQIEDPMGFWKRILYCIKHKEYPPKQTVYGIKDEEQKIADVWYFPYTYCCSICRKDLHLYQEKKIRRIEEEAKRLEELAKKDGPRGFDVIELLDGTRTMVKKDL